MVLKHNDPKRKKRSISGLHYLCIKECAISEHFVLYVENCSLSIIEDNLALPSDITNKNKRIVSLLADNEFDILPSCGSHLLAINLLFFSQQHIVVRVQVSYSAFAPK